MSLIYIGQEITIYGGAIIFVFGLIGNLLNILIFTSVRTYRQNPSVLYFINSSIFSFLYIFINLPFRILSSGFNIDPLRTSVIGCKIRAFYFITTSLIILFSICFATIHQYIVTSRNVRIRQLSTIKSTYISIFLLNAFWMLHGILQLVFYTIRSDTNACGYIDPGYTVYTQIYLFGWNFGIPVFILVLFTYLTYRNLHQSTRITELGIDRQLVRMVFLQVALFMIFLLPYGILNTYSAATVSVVKNINRLRIENLLWTILTLWTYIFYGVSQNRKTKSSFDLFFFFVVGKLLCISFIIKTFSCNCQTANFQFNQKWSNTASMKTKLKLLLYLFSMLYSNLLLLSLQSKRALKLRMCMCIVKDNVLH